MDKKWQECKEKVKRFSLDHRSQIIAVIWLALSILLTSSIEKEIKENTALVSALYVNNEVGTISNVREIASLCNQKGIAFHSDLTQAVGKMDVNVADLGIDYASCSAHKIYGPKGIGAAFLKSDDYGIAPITAFMHGGEQEYGFRAGTLSVHNIVGFGKAAELAKKNLNAYLSRIAELDSIAVERITAIDGIRLTNPKENRLKLFRILKPELQKIFTIH